MKPDLSEIKPAHWRVSVSGMYVYGNHDYVKREREEYEFDCWSGPNLDLDTWHEEPTPCYDRSALEAAHEAGRRAGLEEAKEACAGIWLLAPEDSERAKVAEECGDAIMQMLEQKS